MVMTATYSCAAPVKPLEHINWQHYVYNLKNFKFVCCSYWPMRGPEWFHMQQCTGTHINQYHLDQSEKGREEGRRRKKKRRESNRCTSKRKQRRRTCAIEIALDFYINVRLEGEVGSDARSQENGPGE